MPGKKIDVAKEIPVYTAKLAGRKMSLNRVQQQIILTNRR